MLLTDTSKESVESGNCEKFTFSPSTSFEFDDRFRQDMACLSVRLSNFFEKCTEFKSDRRSNPHTRKLRSFSESTDNSSRVLTNAANEHNSQISTDSLLALLHNIHRELNKLKKYFSLKPLNSAKSPKSSVKSKNTERPVLNSPKKTRANNIEIYNNNMEALLNNRMLILNLLHFECVLLEVFPVLLHSDGGQLASAICSNASSHKLQDMFRSYYGIMSKLCYGKLTNSFHIYSHHFFDGDSAEPTFIKVIENIHSSTTSNTVSLLLLLFRTLTNNPDDEDNESFSDNIDVNMEVSASNSCALDQEKNRTEVNVTNENSNMNIKSMVQIANNKMLVSMFNYVHGLSLNSKFGNNPTKFSHNSFYSSDLCATQNSLQTEGKYLQMIRMKQLLMNTNQGNVTLVYVCNQVLSYFAFKSGSNDSAGMGGKPSSVKSNTMFCFKSTVLQHCIEIMSNMCQTSECQSDASVYDL